MSVDENPEVVPEPSFLQIDPALPTTAISMAASFTMSNMFIYGVTGNAKLAYLASLATIPISLTLCLRSANDDYERWKKMRHLREKGMPVKLMPYPYKFDWSAYDSDLRLKEARRLAKNL